MWGRTIDMCIGRTSLSFFLQSVTFSWLTSRYRAAMFAYIPIQSALYSKNVQLLYFVLRNNLSMFFLIL
jgi:hypothetical protein